MGNCNIPTFHYIRHFSKFIRRGAKRVISPANRDKLQTTAFMNAHGKLVVAIMNTSEEKLLYTLWMGGKGATSLLHSISTLLVE
jgi:glucosylceramidase